MIKGRSCQVEGCCIASEKYVFESPSEHKPDAQYPSLIYNWFHTALYFPLFLFLFVKGVLSHILGQPKRPGWDLFTSTIVSVLHGLRHAYEDASLALWRAIMGMPRRMKKRNDLYYPSPFKAKKLGVKGILAESDALEDGKRVIDAEWVIHPENEQVDDKVILYFHGGGFCVKDWGGCLQIPAQLVKYTSKNVFCKLEIYTFNKSL